MKRSTLFWLLAMLAATAVAVFAGRAYMQRQAATGSPAKAASAPTPQEVPIELAASDVAVAQQVELASALSITGTVKAVNTAVVKAKVAGELKNLQVREGERVQAGQLLAAVDAAEYDLRVQQAEEQATASQAQLDIAQRALNNNKALVEQGFISRTALETAISNVNAAQASLMGARAATELARKAVRDTRVVAPISGLVSQRFVQSGERVGIDARIVEIVDLSRLELEALVPPEEVVSLRVGQTAQVMVDGLVQPVSGRIARINPGAQTGTRSVLAYIALEAAPTLRQGLFARAKVAMQQKAALVVPASAVRFDQSEPYVLVVQDGQAQQRRVSTGLKGSFVLASRATTAANVAHAAQAGQTAHVVQAGQGGAATRAEENVVEVLSGLKAGDVVLRGTVGALRAGTRLTLAGAASPPNKTTDATSGTTSGTTSGATSATTPSNTTPSPTAAASAAQR